MTQEFEYRLKPIRESARLTQKDVADYLGISRDRYANIENLRAKMPAYLVPKFCEICNISYSRFFTYFEQTEKEYIENYNISQGLAAYVNRDKNNRDYVLWLANESDTVFDGIILMSMAYACMPAQQRRHISATMWYVFEYCYSNFKLPDIAEKVMSDASKYKELWQELNKKGGY